jgi:aminopeptidase N
MVAIGNGKLRSVKDNGNKSTYEWFVNNPINNYNVSVQIGNYVAVQDTFIKGDDIHLMNHYVLDYNEELASNYFPMSKEVIRFYEKYFGDYQWYEDGYKLVEVPYLGMEMDLVFIMELEVKVGLCMVLWILSLYMKLGMNGLETA